jgi:glycosyltransferase involved in cell wall biosynthesis
MRTVLLSDRLPPDVLGGAENVAWNLAASLAAAGHEVVAITGGAKAPHVETRQGVVVHHIPTHLPPALHRWQALINPAAVRQVRQIVAAVRPDVVHAHNLHNQLSFAALGAVQRMGIPTVFTAHDFMTFTFGKLSHGLDPEQCGVADPHTYRLPPLYNLNLMRLRYMPFRTSYIRHVLRGVALRTCVSEAHRQALEANLRLPFQVVYNGLQPESMLASADMIEALRTRWSLHGQQVILFSGRFGAQKGSRQLLDAMLRVVEALPNTRLLILTATRLEQLAEWHDVRYRTLLERHVIAGGWLSGDELAAAYHLAYVVTVPSIYHDPFGMVNLEAMAAKKPIVGTCYGGTPEIVVDGETGVIVNPFATARFAEALVGLLRDPDLRQRMGNAGYRRLQAQFTLAHQVRHMLTAYPLAPSAPPLAPHR